MREAGILGNIEEAKHVKKNGGRIQKDMSNYCGSHRSVTLPISSLKKVKCDVLKTLL